MPGLMTSSSFLSIVSSTVTPGWEASKAAVTSDHMSAPYPPSKAATFKVCSSTGAASAGSSAGVVSAGVSAGAASALLLDAVLSAGVLLADDAGWSPEPPHPARSVVAIAATNRDEITFFDFIKIPPFRTVLEEI